jgi:hypothetical protein
MGDCQARRLADSDAFENQTSYDCSSRNNNQHAALVNEALDTKARLSVIKSKPANGAHDAAFKGTFEMSKNEKTRAGGSLSGGAILCGSNQRTYGNSSRDLEQYLRWTAPETQRRPAAGEPGTLRQERHAIELYCQVPPHFKRTDRQRAYILSVCRRIARGS